MPSLQGHATRLMMKGALGRIFRRSRSIPEWRYQVERLNKYQKLPAGTEILPVLVHDMIAERVCAPGVQRDRAVLYLHGGAFVLGSAATVREIAARLSGATNATVLVINYRLAPEHPFPAAMRDAISAYKWLLDKGYSNNRIAVGGESAGGGLALQTLITLRNEGSPLPAAAFLMSPPTDWVRFDGESYSTRAKVDPINRLETCRFTASLYVGDNDPDTPLLSPVHMDLERLPPLCIHVGEYEVLLSDSLRLADNARAASVPVELKVWPAMWHAFQLSARFVPEARRSLDEIGRFVIGHLATRAKK